MNNKKVKGLLSFYILYLVSAVLVGISLPPFFDIPGLGLVALVPLLVAFRWAQNTHNSAHLHWLAVLFFGLPFVLLAYSRYMDVFSAPWIGILLMGAMAMLHTRLVSLGIQLEKKVPVTWSVFVLPTVFAGLEFLWHQIPVVREWRLIPYAKTQRGFPPLLQLMSVTGVVGVTFLLLLINNIIATYVHQRLISKQKSSGLLMASMFAVLSVVFGFGRVWWYQSLESETHVVALVSDMANTMIGSHQEGGMVTDPLLSRQIWERNVSLTETVLDRHPDYVVWSENEFFETKDSVMLSLVQEYAQKNQANMVVDTYEKSEDGLYDVAVLIDAKGGISRARKTYLAQGEKDIGFIPNALDFQSFETPQAKVGLGVCYDFHFGDVVRGLVNQGSELLLFPTDDDLNQNALFPYFHGTDLVFRAIEYGVPVASANTNGVNVLVNADGEIVIQGDVNVTQTQVGEVSTKTIQTFYGRFGDWFGHGLIVMIVIGILYKRKK